MAPALPSIATLSESLLALISILLVVLALLILRGVITTNVLGDGPHPETTNCEHCGAQVSIDEPACSHCGEPIPENNN